MFKLIRDLNLFYKLFYGIIIIVLLVLTASSTASYTYSQNIFEQQSIDSTSRLVNNINSGFEDNLDQMDRIIMSIYADIDNNDSEISMKAVLTSKDYKNLNDQFQQLQATQNFFQRLLNLRKDLNSIYIYVSPQKQFTYAIYGNSKMVYDPTQEDWYKKTIAANGNTVITAPHKPFQLDYNKEVISFSRVLKGLNQNMNDIGGVIMIDLSMNVLNTIVSKANLSAETGVLLTDSEGKIIYSNDLQRANTALTPDIIASLKKAKEGKFTSSFAGAKYLIAFSTSEVTGWKSVTFTPYTDVERFGKQLLLFYIILALAALFITILIAYSFSKIIVTPLQKLKKGFNQLKYGNFDYQLDISSNDEMGQLVFSFNSMITTIKNLIQEKYVEQYARKNAEFKYLQSQMNPHFIYNTLQIISGMAVVNKVPEISAVSKSLSNMLRYSINMNSSTVSIQDEINHVTSYMEIQKLRFREYFNFEIFVEEEVLQYSIIKLTLQPLVENAIIHGIEPKGEKGRVRITAKCINDVIHIEILDNGLGLSEEEVGQIEQAIAKDEAEKDPAAEPNGIHNSVGLRNINQRIKLIYGEEFGLSIDSIKNEWTRVIVQLPARPVKVG